MRMQPAAPVTTRQALSHQAYMRFLLVVLKASLPFFGLQRGLYGLHGYCSLTLFAVQDGLVRISLLKGTSR